MPTSRGQAARWWVPSQYTSVPRLMMATRVAVRPATILELHHITGICYNTVYQIMRNWVRRGYAEWTMGHPTGPNARRYCRVVSLTQDGRRDLWRYGWVTRRLRFSEFNDVPLRADMPADPIEALRLHARHEFLRPASLALLEELIGWPRQSECQLGRHTEDYTAARRYMKLFRRAGYVSDAGGPSPNDGNYRSFHWVLNDRGCEALDRHVDALRRAALASGYTPTRACEPWYPNEDSSPCAMSIRREHPAPCHDCLWWYLEERDFQPDSPDEPPS